MPIAAWAPELNCRKSASIPSLKMTPFSGIKENPGLLSGCPCGTIRSFVGLSLRDNQIIHSGDLSDTTLDNQVADFIGDADGSFSA